MGDEEGMWGKPSKFFISDKPIDLKPLDGSEFTCEVEPTRLDTLADVVAQESVDNARFVADQSSHTITMEVKITPKQMREMRKLLRVPRLPRKLKKYVKKNCLTSDAPKRISPQVLRLAFALNFPNKAHRVGYRIGLDLANEPDVGNVT